MAQDRFRILRYNIRSLALAVEGFRQMQRNGNGSFLERAFARFRALPEKKWSH